MSDPGLAPLRPRIGRRLRELDEPLRLAIAGHVSAGKSTLVNALIGRRLAATGSGETTAVNAWFRFDTHERVGLRLIDGTVVERPLPSPGQPIHMPSGFDSDHTQAITYFIDEPLLLDLTIIDTPGLFSPSSEKSKRADALLADRTSRAADMANALLYLTQEVPGSAVEDAQLQAFQSLFRGFAGKLPINSILVLSKIDQKWKPAGGDGRDPYTIANDLIARHDAELWRRVWTTAPLIAHLAEITRTDSRVSDAELTDLVKLAEYPHRSRLLESDTALVLSGVPPERARTLRKRLGKFGLSRALAAIDAGATTSAEVVQELYVASNLESILTVVQTVFRERSTLLKAESVLSGIESDAYNREGDITAQAAGEILRLVESVRFAEASRDLRRLHAIRLVCQEESRLSMSPARRQELRRLFGGQGPRERLGEPPDAALQALAASARRQGKRWKAIQQISPLDPDLRWIAEEAESAYDAQLDELVRASQIA